MSLTDAQLGEFKEAFEIFDKEKTGSLTSEQLGLDLRPTAKATSKKLKRSPT